MINNWLGMKGMQFIKTLIKAQQELYEHVKGLFSTLNEILSPNIMT